MSKNQTAPEKSTTDQETEGEPNTERTLNREEVVANILEDYYECEQELVEDGYYVWQSAKTADGREKYEQSHVQHVRNAVDFLCSLYTSLDDDSTPLDEETLRRAIATLIPHDYHKRREEEVEYSERFEISVDEAADFIETCSLHRLAGSLTAKEVRGVMAAHHLGDDDALHESVPRSVVDAFNFAVLADAVAGSASLDSAHLKNIQDRLTSALVCPKYTVRTHQFTHDSTMFAKLVNKAVANTLNEREGWKSLRVFSDGVLYLSVGDEEIESEGMLDDILDSVQETLADSHLLYTDETTKSDGLQMRMAADDADTEGEDRRTYDVSHRDIFFLGRDETVESIIERAVRDSQKTSPISDTQQTRIDEEIAPFIETDIYTETRRVDGLSRAVETLYRDFVEPMLRQMSGPGERYSESPTKVMLEVFGVYTDERFEELQNLRSENGDKLDGRHWLYKYLLAQYIYEDYYDGRGFTVIKRDLSETVIGRLSEFDLYDGRGGEVEKIWNELTAYLARDVEVDGESLADLVESDPVMDFLNTDPETEACTFCGENTTAHEDGLGRQSDSFFLLKYPPNLRMKTDDGATVMGDDTTLCYACQTEIAVRRSHSKIWEEKGEGDDPALYVRFKTDYGYVPLSWCLQDRLLWNQCLGADGESFTPDDIVSHVMANGEQPDPYEGRSSFLDHMTWADSDRGFNPREGFAGWPRPIAPLDDDEACYHAVSACILAAVYSGVGVHFSAYPMKSVEKDNKEFITFGEDAVDEVPFFGETILLQESRRFTEQFISVNELADESGMQETLVADDEVLAENECYDADCPLPPRWEVFRHCIENTNRPGSRLFRQAHENGADVEHILDGRADPIQWLDERFSPEDTDKDLAIGVAESMSTKLLKLGFDNQEAAVSRIDADLQALINNDGAVPDEEAMKEHILKNIDDPLPLHRQYAREYVDSMYELGEIGSHEPEMLAAIRYDILDVVYARILKFGHVMAE